MTVARTAKPPLFSKKESWRIFEDIAPCYDTLNRVLSWGLDIRWRQRLTRFLPAGEGLQVLDLATGTADVPLILLERSDHIRKVCGIDLSEKMLRIGRNKVERRGLSERTELRRGDAGEIPYPENTFDAATMAFGIRNVPDVPKTLREIHRVLRHQSGRALILEFSLPANPLIRQFHLIYLRYLVPAIGHLFSGHYQAYRYLNETIEAFPYGEDFCRLLRDAGFRNVRVNRLLFGVASIYQGDKE